MPADAAAKIAAGPALKPTADAALAAIRNAGAKTGVGFDLLYRMAKRESALDATAKAKTSTAAGLFQFIEQTWLGAVKLHGARHGLADAAAAIERGADGRYRVADAARRAEILNLRFNPEAASALAAELVRDNRAALEARLGRPVDAGEIYAAHFLGPAGAAKLISAPDETLAADLLPAAAAANRPVFYDGTRARSAGEVRLAIARSMGIEAAGAPVAAPDAAMSPAPAPAIAPAIAPERKSADFMALALPAAPQRDAFRPPFAGVSAPMRADAEAVQGFKTLFALREENPSPGLSALAIAVLQTLDPTRLAMRRADDASTSTAR